MLCSLPIFSSVIFVSHGGGNVCYLEELQFLEARERQVLSGDCLQLLQLNYKVSVSRVCNIKFPKPIVTFSQFNYHNIFGKETYLVQSNGIVQETLLFTFNFQFIKIPYGKKIVENRQPQHIRLLLRVKSRIVC